MQRIVYSAKEAAEVLGTDRARVQKLLESGEIPAYRDGRNWKIPCTLLQKYVENKALMEARERSK